MAKPGVYQAVLDQYSDWHWRLNNLYWITDKEGKRVIFEMNWAQEALFDNMHFLNVVLKARQLGFTTFIQLFMLDAVVFNSNIRAGTIAHNLDDAKTIFRDKVRFPYDNLPDKLKAGVPEIRDSATELLLANNSSIRVGTSHRSGTLQYLHISEYGKICAKYPEKAEEIRTGALNTVQAGEMAFIESTAEGQEGHFYDLCEQARAKQRMASKLTSMDFKFHFFPWWKNPEYTLDPDGVTVSDELTRYFDGLVVQHGIELTAGQRAWYAKKSETQFEKMKREYPSTADEAFEASVEGAYYARQIAVAELQGRIGHFPAHLGIKVNTVWDIGVGDLNTLWCFQLTPARIRLIWYYENSGEGMVHYLVELEKKAEQNGWEFGIDYLPHDAKVMEWGTGRTRFEQMMNPPPEAMLKKRNVTLIPRGEIDDGINAARTIFPICEFDEEGCAGGLKALRNYRKEWNEQLGTWMSRPRHDWASHGADGFRGLGMLYRDLKAKEPDKFAQIVQAPRHLIGLKPPPKVLTEMTYDEFHKATEPGRKRERV